MTHPTIGPSTRPAPRNPAKSARCHIADTNEDKAGLHQGCDGTSYPPTLLGRGTPCICPCHQPDAADRDYQAKALAWQSLGPDGLEPESR